ncbi:uncharacterized protein EMH_0034210 [Eimeria mitis]|uniref:Uncharacterized protein n=1 Tax=Eimeria mitis TaxID=44415 RepID=U6JW28_9EIME|nr:uncharacterized protein EMH_0034210 [Eimeria mitis]CDJ27723.1 hypothetical protein EMH_0034210 [Eimeria mitis]
MSTRDLTFQGVVLLIFISLINTAAWLGCMLARAVFLTVIVNIGLYQKQSVSSLLTTVDPELVYFLWSVGMYIFWQRNVRPGKLFCVKDIDASKSTIQLYDTSLFGQSWFVLPSIAKCQGILSLLIILLAARRLVQSIMIFYFELGFMASMNGQVVKYLTKYAALRKLNTKWAAYHLCKDTLSQGSCDGTSQEDEDRMDGGGGLRCTELRRGRSMISVTSRTSRFSRHPSLRVPTRALPSLVLDKP